MNCFECGTPRKQGGKFCGYCGVSYATAPESDPDASNTTNDNSRADYVQPRSAAVPDRMHPHRMHPQNKSRKDSNTLIIVSATIIIVIGIASILFLVFRSNGIS